MIFIHDIFSFKPLVSLEVLNLSQNNLEQLDDPELFKTLTKLVYLNLGTNKISSIHHETFKSLSSLRKLNLINNKIQRLERLELFASLINLEYLYLDDNIYKHPNLFDSIKKLKTNFKR